MKRCILVTALIAFSPPLYAQEGAPPEGSTDVLKGAPYSPNANRGFPTKVLFGDTHVHSALSADAGGGRDNVDAA